MDLPFHFSFFFFFHSHHSLSTLPPFTPNKNQMSLIRALPLARRAISAAPRFSARAYSAQASAPSGGAGKTLFVAALAAGAGAAGYHFYADSQSKFSP